MDRINILWDHDFSAIKQRLYADVWKFGIGVYDTQPQGASFSIYSVPQGASAPLVKRVGKDELQLPNVEDLISGQNAGKITNVQITWIQGRPFPQLPQDADKFVFEKVESALKRRLLPLYGLALYREVLWDFVDNHYESLGVQKAERYRLGDLRERLRSYFLLWYFVGFRKFVQRAKGLGAPPIWPDFEDVAQAWPSSARPNSDEITRAAGSSDLVALPPLKFHEPLIDMFSMP